MLEAIPSATRSLIEALGLVHLIDGVGMAFGGLQNLWDPKNPIARSDSLLVFDRAEFARHMLEAAVSRGAVVEQTRGRPSLTSMPDYVSVQTAGHDRKFKVAVDATGRAAIWSRPTARENQICADIFNAAPTKEETGLCLRRSSAGWTYRLGSRESTTIAILSAHNPHHEVPDSFDGTFGISSRSARYIGRRAASIQWAEYPIRDRVIAVGDAALAHDPISGQGIRFGLASALAAASVIRTWFRPGCDRATTSEFYTEFVAAERKRHMEFVRSLYGVSDAEREIPTGARTDFSSPTLTGSSSERSGKLRFHAPVESAGLHINGLIKRSEVIRLPDGSSVRWLGGFDLLRLRALADSPVHISHLQQLLSYEGFVGNRAAELLNWCLARGILRIEIPENTPAI
jgi:flavin-dependent dehydrogenase